MAILVVVLTSTFSHAGATVSLATNGRDTAQLICNGSLVLNDVYYLRLTLSDGALLISWRESLRSGAPDRLLILTNSTNARRRKRTFPFLVQADSTVTDRAR